MATFEDFGLNPMIMQALQEIGFETPTPIQSKTIPHLINSDKDLIALAQTGTGKTAAFSLPVIQQIYAESDVVQAMVLCPTRELAIQVAEDIKKFVKYLPDVRVAAVFGGERIDKQIRVLKKKPQIVVGTPGRVNDMIRRRLLKLENLSWLILDEADEMLKMGFKEELDEILETVPEEKQALLFSATMDKPVRRIAQNYMNKPEEITVGNRNQGSDNVEHFFYVAREKDRYDALRRIADAHPHIHGIVFCRTRRETQEVADKLIQDHYSAEAIHGDISQEQRTHVMNRFRKGKIELLVATDVAARGIDVSGLTHVINYNLPDSMEAYVHRSGRTGRAHSEGVSLVIVNMREKHKIRALENKIGKSFTQGMIPSGEDICERQLFNLIEKVSAVEVNEETLGKYDKLIEKKFEGIDREELIKKFVSVEFNRFLDLYKDARDLNVSAQKDEKFRKEKSSILFARFSLNIGRKDNLTTKDLLDFLNDQPELNGVEVGNISINRRDSEFEVDERYKESVLLCFNGAEMDGVTLQAVCEATGLPSSRFGGKKGFKKRKGRGGFNRGGGGRGGDFKKGKNFRGGGKKKRFR